MKEHLKQLYNTDPIARFEAIAALAELGERAVPILMEMLASPHRLACRSALNTLLRIDKPRFEPLLMPLLQREWKGLYGLSPQNIGTPESILSDSSLSTPEKVARLQLLPAEYRTRQGTWGRVVVDSIEDYCERMMKDTSVSASMREGARKVWEERTLLQASRAPESVEELLRPIYGKYDPSDPQFLLRATAQAEGTALPIVPSVPKEALGAKFVGEYVSIPGGVYLLGHASTSNNPPHFVSILGFEMSKYPVTVREYKAYCRAMGSKMPDAPHFNRDWGKEDHPIVSVTWEEARGYCLWAGGDLPTEVEWEVASRGGLVGKEFPWGDGWNGGKCANEYTSRGGTVSVGRYAPNGYGLYDMSGNVWEWCLDGYESDVWKNAEIDAFNLNNINGLILRGCAWNFSIPYLFHCGYRNIRDDLDIRNSCYGFRVVFR